MLAILEVFREKVGVLGGVYKEYINKVFFIRNNYFLFYDSIIMVAILQVFREKVGVIGGL